MNSRQRFVLAGAALVFLVAMVWVPWRVQIVAADGQVTERIRYDWSGTARAGSYIVALTTDGCERESYEGVHLPVVVAELATIAAIGGLGAYGLRASGTPKSDSL